MPIVAEKVLSSIYTTQLFFIKIIFVSTTSYGILGYVQLAAFDVKIILKPVEVAKTIAIVVIMDVTIRINQELEAHFKHSFIYCPRPLFAYTAGLV